MIVGELSKYALAGGGNQSFLTVFIKEVGETVPEDLYSACYKQVKKSIFKWGNYLPKLR